ncbi:Orf y [Tanacetum coccineum]
MPPKRTLTSVAPAMTQAAIWQLVIDSVAAALEAQAATMANTDKPQRTSGPRKLVFVFSYATAAEENKVNHLILFYAQTWCQILRKSWKSSSGDYQSSIEGKYLLLEALQTWRESQYHNPEVDGAVSHVDVDVDNFKRCCTSYTFDVEYKFGILSLLQHEVIAIANRIRGWGKIVSPKNVYIRDFIDFDATMFYLEWFVKYSANVRRTLADFSHAPLNEYSPNPNDKKQWSLGEVNPTHAYYNDSRTSKDNEDPSCSTRFKTRRTQKTSSALEALLKTLYALLLYLLGILKNQSSQDKDYKKKEYIGNRRPLYRNIASKYVFPHDLWENSPREIIATIANGDTIKINQVCRNISLKLSGYEFNIPTIYQQDSGIDLILGNNFCQLFGPFVQWIDRIAFHLNDELIIIKKVTKAFSQGQPNFLESMKKDSKIKQIPGTNISQENIKGCNIFLQINKYKIIEEILDKVCSENPIDPQKTKGWMKATIKLIDPNTVIRVKPMCYSPQDRIEFTKQINELLNMRAAALCLKAFRAGLINNIYPSNNLLEIKEFQSSVFETIKKFRKNVLKAQDKKIYIKVTSSIPDWNHEENYSPYHCMEIGLARKNEELHFSKAMEDKLQNPFLEVSRFKGSKS